LKTLLKVTFVFEAATGLGLLFAPAQVVSILLNSSLVEPSGILLGRLAGAALISIAIMCWMYSYKEHAGGVVKALLFYNVAAAALLVYALSGGFAGLPLWAVTLLHAGMAVWCVTLLQKNINN
jgi:hypothetical protein